jgi:hypothetical protein
MTQPYLDRSYDQIDIRRYSRQSERESMPEEELQKLVSLRVQDEKNASDAIFAAQCEPGYWKRMAVIYPDDPVFQRMADEVLK